MATEKLTKSYLHVPRKRPFLGLSMGQQLYKMADKYGDKEMYVFYVDQERITFKQMKQQSQRFASSLITKGYKKGDTIAIWGANHAEWLVALFATMQLGILLVPLRLEFSEPTIVALLNKLKCKGLILTRSPSNLLNRVYTLLPELNGTASDVGFHSERFPDMEFFIICGTAPEEIFSRKYVYSYDEFMSLGSEADVDNVDKICMSLDMDEPCIICFTSGSTGMPKATVISSHAMLNAMVNIGFRREVDNFQYDLESARFAEAITFSGGAASFGIIAPLTLGLTTIILFPEFDVEIMAKALHDERVTMGVFLIHHVHDLLNLPNISDYDFSSLDILNIGGSVIPSEMRQNLKTICKHVIVVFGMTECFLTLMSHPNDPEEKKSEAAMYPVGGIETKIVDGNGCIVPVATMGEIHFRTYSAFQYYVGEPEKTKEMKDENGWLHTGDLGCMDQDGFVQVCGRKKELIIKEGLNLPPAELEKRLYQNTHVNAAVVIGLPDPRVGEEICACIRLDNRNALTEEEIRKFCEGKVHALLVPKYILFVNEIPTTATGKFSRPTLKQMAIEKFQVK